MGILETGWIIQFMQCHGRSSIMAAVRDGDLGRSVIMAAVHGGNHGTLLDHLIYVMSR